MDNVVVLERSTEAFVSLVCTASFISFLGLPSASQEALSVWVYHLPCNLLCNWVLWTSIFKCSSIWHLVFIYFSLWVTSGLPVFGLLFTRCLEPLPSCDGWPQTHRGWGPAGMWALLWQSVVFLWLWSCALRGDWDSGFCSYLPGPEVVKEPFKIKRFMDASPGYPGVKLGVWVFPLQRHIYACRCRHSFSALTRSCFAELLTLDQG